MLKKKMWQGQRAQALLLTGLADHAASGKANGLEAVNFGPHTALRDLDDYFDTLPTNDCNKPTCRCVCVCGVVCVCVYVCLSIDYLCGYVCVYIDSTHTHTHTHTYINTYIHMHIYLYVHMHIYLYI